MVILVTSNILSWLSNHLLNSKIARRSLTLHSWQLLLAAKRWTSIFYYSASLKCLLQFTSIVRRHVNCMPLYHIHKNHFKMSENECPSLWPSGIGSRLGRNRSWVWFLAVSDIYPMFIERTITWVPSGFSGYIWLDTKIVLNKNLPMPRIRATHSIFAYILCDHAGLCDSIKHALETAIFVPAGWGGGWHAGGGGSRHQQKLMQHDRADTELSHSLEKLLHFPPFDIRGLDTIEPVDRSDRNLYKHSSAMYAPHHFICHV